MGQRCHGRHVEFQSRMTITNLTLTPSQTKLNVNITGHLHQSMLMITCKLYAHRNESNPAANGVSRSQNEL